jgi:hypothetical protein
MLAEKLSRYVTRTFGPGAVVTSVNTQRAETHVVTWASPVAMPGSLAVARWWATSAGRSAE